MEMSDVQLLERPSLPQGSPGDAAHEDPAQMLCKSVVPEFEALIRSYAIFNGIFAALIAFEAVVLLILFPLLLTTSYLAFGVAALFLTIFAFLVFRGYHAAEKPESYKRLVDKFVAACKTFLYYREEMPEDYLKLSGMCMRLSDAFSFKEGTLYRCSGRLKVLNPYLERLSGRLHWSDIHDIRRLLLKEALGENIKLVRCAPTSFEAHTSLANAYVMLASLYSQAVNAVDHHQWRWFPQEEQRLKMQQYFKTALLRAVEEFKILNSYAPNDPWVHQQLAYSYQDLGMRDEEILEYELMTRITPQDQEAWYKLGELYFKEGCNAKGLTVYEMLKVSHPKKAAHLIKLYGQVAES